MSRYGDHDPNALGCTCTDCHDDSLSALDRAHQAAREADAMLGLSIAAARGRGASWASIGAHLGMSRQAAWERFKDLD